MRKLAGTLPFPIEIDRCGMGAHGVPWPRVSDAPLAFAFADQDRIFAALAMRSGERIRVRPCGEIAPLPYSVETPGRPSRPRPREAPRAVLRAPS